VIEKVVEISAEEAGVAPKPAAAPDGTGDE
jgi:hypothetical protein